VYPDMLLTKKKTFITTREDVIVYKNPDLDSVKLAKLKKDVIGELLSCENEVFCKIKIMTWEGYILKDTFFGAKN
jgi:SH3-like domain-containing protein